MTRTRIALVAITTTCAITALAVGTSTAVDDKSIGRIGPSLGITGNGRALDPAGRQTTVGNFPGGAALSPDGKFLWAVASGHGASEVTVVKVSDGSVSQRLPLPGSTGNVAFSPDGSRAYVAGISKGNSTPSGTVKGAAGDVIHVFSVDGAGGATELDPIALPANPGGGQSMPSGLAVSPNGAKLAVALLRGKICGGGAASCATPLPASKVFILDLASSGPAKAIDLDLNGLTHGVAWTPNGSKLLVTDEMTGTLDVVDPVTGSYTKVGVGGPSAGDGTGDVGSHPGAIAVSPDGQYAWVAVANRDLVARVKLSDLTATFTNIGRSPAWGVQPVDIALSGSRIFVADSGEDAIAVLDTSSGTPTLIGRIPTAAYPTAVSVTPDGSKIVWTTGKGYGTGPNGNGSKQNGSQYIPDMILGKVGVLDNPGSSALAALTARADAQVRPANFTTAPPKTALTANGPIKYVFYIIRENRTYDQVLGDDPRGDGDPTLTEFGDNGLAGPAGGITPNVHSLVRKYPLLDHFYSNSEVSVDGHLIVSQGMAIDTAQRRFQYSYSGRGYSDVDFLLPQVFAPKVSLFDQAVRQGVSAANFGEVYSGNQGTDGRSTLAGVRAMYQNNYPMNMGCGVNPALNDRKTKNPNLTNSPLCNTDSSMKNLSVTAFGQKLWHSRVDLWRDWFKKQLTAKTLPSLVVIWLPNDHTNGTGAGNPTPRAMVADNDLGLGQLVDTISKSSVWRQSAIFSVEDDSQAGMDHVDGHRQIGLVVSPWAKKAAVVHTRYDQDSMLRSAMMLLGLQPLTLADAFATPMYDAFIRTTDRPNTATYTAIKPTYPLTAVNTATQSRIAGKLSEKLPYDDLDAVPQPLFDEMIWKSVFGNSRPVPKPGPNSSKLEMARYHKAVKALAAGEELPFEGVKREDD